GDDLARPDLGRTGHRAGGEERAKQIRNVGGGRKRRGNGGGELVHRGVVLDLEECGRRDRAELSDPTDVVPQEIDDHEVLGAILRRPGELRGERLVLLDPPAAGPGSLHGPQLDRPSEAPEEEFRRSRYERVPPHREVRTEGRSLRPREVRVQCQRGPTEAPPPAQGEVHLVGAPRGDPPEAPPYLSFVLAGADGGIGSVEPIGSIGPAEG